MTARGVIRALEAAGRQLKRSKGSHRHFQHPSRPGTVTVPDHGSCDLGEGLIRSIERASGLPLRWSDDTMRKVFPALVTKAGSADYGVVFPDLPGCVTTGDTLDEAARMAIEALAGHLEVMAAAGEAVPDPQPLDGPLPDWLPAPADAVRLLVPVEIPGGAVRVNISIDKGLLARLDRAAAASHETRSGFIARAVRETIEAAMPTPTG